ncbi:MAG TPA: MBL fold metallo-hydrolase [Ktedonobacterales bacterium]|nr:MBL fold metallo-hydrolase [Ktedonobacterales bacterium]
MMQERKTASAERFRLEQIADGVYAAIVIAGRGAQGNAGLIDLGDGRILVFDTFLTPAAAQEFRAAAERLLGGAPTLVVNSHWHGDHINGNQVFAGDAHIIATERTREIMATRGMAALERARQSGPDDLVKREAELAAETDPAKRQTMELDLGEIRELVAALPTMRVCLPDITFNQRMTLHGARRTVEIITLGGGHTDSDAFLYLPGERIAFIGDLVFAQSHPWMGHGHPDAWLDILTQIEGMPIDIAVPGHGPVGTLADCARNRHYITTAQEIIGEAIKRGATLEEVKQLAMPAPFDTWADADVFAWNAEFLYKQQTA